MEVFIMGDFFGFSSDRVDVFMLLIDTSGSMRGTESDMSRGLQMYKKSFENFAGANSIAVSVSEFSSDLRIKEFESVNSFDTSYSSAGGGTALYYSIVNSAKYLENYIKEIQEEKGIDPKATFICFSDGEPNDNSCNERDAAQAIRTLNEAGITTVFVAFGKSMQAKFGERLGFQSTIDVRNQAQLVNFFGVTLSKSCKEQSMSMKGLGANFFSGAERNSNGFSQASNQALKDDSWFKDI